MVLSIKTLKFFNANNLNMKQLTGVLLLTILFGCSKMPENNVVRDFQDIEKQLIGDLIMVEDSGVIELEEGHFLFSKSLILEGKNNVTIKGKGIDKTVISFNGQKDGAEGFRVANCTNILMQDFTIEDAAGDNIKVTDTDGITIRRIKSGWTGTVSKDNGAYGLYPVLSKRVVVDECEVLGASDAGIYVGQSENVVISNNTVYWNVAGIESENSENVEIYGNKAYENTGGILVFDLPGLTRYGKNITVFDNEVTENNLDNFAPPGNIVGMVPPGTGLLILATRNVEAYNNRILNNRTVGAGIISYILIDAMGNDASDDNQQGGMQSDFEKDKNYDPYPGNIYLHDNEFENEYSMPSMGNDFGKLFVLKFKTDLPHVIWDGIMHENFYLEDQSVNPVFKICVQEAEGVKTATLDAANDFEGLESNPEVFNCNASI